MCGTRTPTKLFLVRADDLVRVVVEIEHTGNTITGRIAVEGCPADRFYGWLELIDRLDRAASPTELGRARE